MNLLFGQASSRRSALVSGVSLVLLAQTWSVRAQEPENSVQSCQENSKVLARLLEAKVGPDLARITRLVAAKLKKDAALMEKLRSAAGFSRADLQKEFERALKEAGPFVQEAIFFLDDANPSILKAMPKEKSAAAGELKVVSSNPGIALGEEKPLSFWINERHIRQSFGNGILNVDFNDLKSRASEFTIVETAAVSLLGHEDPSVTFNLQVNLENGSGRSRTKLIFGKGLGAEDFAKAGLLRTECLHVLHADSAREQPSLNKSGDAGVGSQVKGKRIPSRAVQEK